MPNVCTYIHAHAAHLNVCLSEVEYRGQFFAEVQFYDVKQFVWVDETGSDDRNRRRKFGYSLKR